LVIQEIWLYGFIQPRLLGRNSELVLHGGGNTSVKTSIKDIDGKNYDVYVLKEVDGIWLILSQQVCQQ
jgi:rhamnose utilization protein RhaD (predicted bifunctional aldolase and dehydrogenase)